MTTKKADKQTHELGGANELNSFRLYRQSELARRCSKNPNYSVRAFAKSLSIEHSSLAKILSGKRLLTAPMIQRLAKNLELRKNLRGLTFGTQSVEGGRKLPMNSIYTIFISRKTRLSVSQKCDEVAYDTY